MPVLRHVLMATIAILLICNAPGLGSSNGYAQSSEKTASRTLTVATVERPPFSVRSPDGHSGFSIDLWKAIAKDRNWTFTFQNASSFKNMLDAVQSGDADLAIANISITAKREQVIDFSQPVFDSGLQILVSEDGQSMGVLSAIFTLDMLGWVLAAGLLLFTVGNLMWYFERRSQPYFDTSYREGLWPSFWWALNLLINGGFEERVPRSIPGRVFGTFLVVASLFIVSAFVAKITTAMTVGQLRTQVQGINDLYGKRVATTGKSTAEAFLTKNGVRHKTFANLDELFAALEKNQVDAVVHDAPIVSYYAATSGKGIARTAGSILQPEKYGIALRQGSPLTEEVNRALLRIRENGTYAMLVKRWFGDAYE